MWFKLLVCFLVASAFANHNPGWKHNTEYIYQVRGRTLTSLDQNSDAYSGIFLKAQLAVRPKPDGNLGAQISNLQYADFQGKLQDWVDYVPDSELSYQEIPLSSGNIKIVMDNGVVRDLVVDKNIPNWEANIIKAIVSQLQFDSEGENEIRSSINIRVDGADDAVFKTMEKTVTGESETLYEIHPMPAHVLKTKPWLVPLPNPDGNEKYIEVVKNKNYTHSQETPAYHFGWEGVEDFEMQNKIGEFLSRATVSRMYLSGSISSFTLQSSLTFDRVSLQPNLQDKQRGSTNSIVNITLTSMEQQNEEFEDVPNPAYVGLVYSYNSPFANSNEAKEKKTPIQTRMGSYVSRMRTQRDLHQSSAETGMNANGGEDFYSVQEQPHISGAPESPLLPFTVGYDGQAISKKQNVPELVRVLAKQIGREFQQPDNIPEQNTIGKFISLASLIRVMNYDGMKHASQQLYTNEKHGSDYYAWVAYRDAVAEAGTGPSLLLIKDWIQRGQISGGKAAQVVASAADSARQPTEKYMRIFFSMIENEEIMQQQHLNDSLLLSFTDLVHDVYVNKQISHNKYPVHSFGSFNTEQGRIFVEQEVIPFLSQKLDQAVARGDTKRIHLYIRALGNVGHPKILSVFKPYLEGEKKMSQFQRVLMVVAFDNLVRYKPVVARSVLYKLYKNPREFEQVRVAAVYQLIRASPSPAMLQSMAAYTNIDTSNYVNSAVKSVIESSAELPQPKFARLRSAAQSAKALLTPREFGVQNSKSFMLNYVTEEMRMEVKQIVEMFGGEDSVVPKGINYLLRARFGGDRQQLLKMQWMVSSVDDLINVFERQTKHYRRLLKEKQSYDGIKVKWSSEYTAKLMNMQNEQREQLENYILLEVDALNKIWSFDNHTVENLTNVVKELEEELRQKQHYDYNKMSIHPEIALSFPTAWGLPFIYTYDKPAFFHLESQVKANAEPSIHSSQGLQTPESVDVEYNLKGFVSGRSQSQFGVFAPFNNRRYSAGYDKNFQAQLPALSGKVLFDIRNRQVTIEIESTERKNVNLLHFSTWPYTTQYEIHDFRPKTNIIKDENQQKINAVFGEKSTGVALSLHVASDQTIDYASLYQKMSEENLASFVSSWLDDNIQHSEINLNLNAAKTTSKKMIVHVGHQQRYTPGMSPNRDNSEKPKSMIPISQESWERQKEFLRNSSKGIKSAHSQVLDATILFEGQRIIKYSTTFAGARSNMDPKGRFLMQAEKDNQRDQPLKVYFQTLSDVPNTNSLDVDFALDYDPTSDFQVLAGVQEKNQNPSEIELALKLSKSEDRKQHLRQQLQYRQCKEQMKEGDNQLPACAMLTAQANLLNAFGAKVKYTNVDPVLINGTYKMYSILREHFYPRISENIIMENGRSGKNEIWVEGKFSPDLSTVNASATTKYGRVEITDVPVNNWARSLLVLHPVHRVHERVQGEAFNYDAYHPLCVVDQKNVNTLDNKTYPVSFDNDWVVLLHYVPRYPSSIKNQPELTVTEQLNEQVEGYIIYGRAPGSGNPQKEIKMVIQSPNTMGKVVDVTIKPTDSSSHPRLFVQGEQIMYNDDGTHLYDDYMQVYKLPNNEIKVEVYDSFSVIYDGVRAKILVVNDKFRDASRGLCGTFTDEPETDFTHPGNCIIQSPEVFVATNTVPEKQRTKRMNDMLMIQAEEKKCYQKTVGYTKVVSVQNSDLEYSSMMSDSMTRKTKYVKMGDEICFSLRPLASCNPGQREYSVKAPVGVHCVKMSGVSQLWMEKADQGLQVDIGHKSESRQVLMKVAQKCE